MRRSLNTTLTGVLLPHIVQMLLHLVLGLLSHLEFFGYLNLVSLEVGMVLFNMFPFCFQHTLIMVDAALLLCMLLQQPKLLGGPLYDALKHQENGGER